MRARDLKMSLFNFRIGEKNFEVTEIKTYPTYIGFLEGDLKYVTKQIISRLGQEPGQGNVYFLKYEKVISRTDSELLPAYRYEIELRYDVNMVLDIVFLSDSGLSNLENELTAEISKIDINKLIQDYAKEFDY